MVQPRCRPRFQSVTLTDSAHLLLLPRPTEMKRKSSGLLRRLGIWRGARAYQDKLAGAFDERCRQLERAIPDDARSVLDIGCNLGDITAWCATRGLWAVGIDSSADLIGAARKRYRDVARCGFMQCAVGPADIGALPTFDVVLLLSVHHHWLMAHGPETAGQMLRDLAERTGRVLVFEGASRNVRYGKYPPGFEDNDEASVTTYLRGYLDQYVGDRFASIEPLGRTACVGEREPWRWAWALRK
jgi:SAM-dependent methyltransferase